jgi:hypothetical protein
MPLNIANTGKQPDSMCFTGIGGQRGGGNRLATRATH